MDDIQDAPPPAKGAPAASAPAASAQAKASGPDVAKLDSGWGDEEDDEEATRIGTVPELVALSRRGEVIDLDQNQRVTPVKPMRVGGPTTPEDAAKHEATTVPPPPGEPSPEEAMEASEPEDGEAEADEAEDAADGDRADARKEKRRAKVEAQKEKQRARADAADAKQKRKRASSRPPAGAARDDAAPSGEIPPTVSSDRSPAPRARDWWRMAVLVAIVIFLGAIVLSLTSK